MSWQIHAWLNDGKPNLEIVDPETGEVQLRWACNLSCGGTEVQQLFRQLLLLSCKQDLCNGQLLMARPHRSFPMSTFEPGV